MFRELTLLVMGGLVGIGSGQALQAQQKDPIALFNEASDLAEKGKLQEAVALWVMVADDIPEKHRPVVQANLGMAYKQLDMLPQAWYHFGRYLNTQQDPDVEAERRDLEKKLAKTHKLVSIRCMPEGATVHIQSATGTTVPYRCPLSFWFKPGKQPVRVTAEGHKHRIDLISIDSNVAKPDFHFELESLAGPVVAEVPQRGGIPWWTWAMVGGGAAALAGGVTMQAIGVSRNNDLHDKYPDGTPGNPQPASNKDNYEAGYDSDVRPMLIGAYTLCGLGAAAAITGAVLMFVQPGAKETGSASAGPMVVPHGAGMNFSLTF